MNYLFLAQVCPDGSPIVNGNTTEIVLCNVEHYERTLVVYYPMDIIVLHIEYKVFLELFIFFHQIIN